MSTDERFDVIRRALGTIYRGTMKDGALAALVSVEADLADLAWTKAENAMLREGAAKDAETMGQAARREQELDDALSTARQALHEIEEMASEYARNNVYASIRRVAAAALARLGGAGSIEGDEK